VAINTAIPVIKVRGSHRDIGRQIGEAGSAAISRQLEVYHRIFEDSYDQLKLTWGEAILQASKYYPFAREHLPQYVDELDGIAEGAGVEFDDLLVLNCMEAITSDALHLGCTSIAVSAERSKNGHVLVGHNEDWLPDDEENVLLIHAKPDDEPAFMSITYGGLLPNVGFNAAGIAQCCDTVYPTDARLGIPRLFVSRAVLAQAQISTAIRAAIVRQRAAGYNHLIAEKHGELYSIEVSAQRFATIYGLDGTMVHTNNYQTKRMKQYENKTEDLIGSRIRANRAKRLITHTELHTLDTFREILSDHVNHPYSICSHTDPADRPIDQQKTIASLIMDLTALEMHIAWGNPCTETFHTYSLEN
jgi:isopenicillin-N N-acyltransferase-like protein